MLILRTLEEIFIAEMGTEDISYDRYKILLFDEVIWHLDSTRRSMIDEERASLMLASLCQYFVKCIIAYVSESYVLTQDFKMMPFLSRIAELWHLYVRHKLVKAITHAIVLSQ